MIHRYACVLEATDERWAIRRIELTISAEDIESAKSLVEHAIPDAKKSKYFRWLKLEETKG